MPDVGTGSRPRIAPSKMLPNGKRRAIWNVTLDGPAAGGGLHDECSRAVGVPEGHLRPLSAGAAGGRERDSWRVLSDDGPSAPVHPCAPQPGAPPTGPGSEAPRGG